KQGLPQNEFLNLALLLNNPEVTRVFIDQLKSPAADSLPKHERLFASLALQTYFAEKPSASAWKTSIDTAFQATTDGTSPDQFMRWPTILGRLLEKQPDLSEANHHLRKAAFVRMGKVEGSDAVRTREYLRAANALMAADLVRGDQAAAGDTVDAIVRCLAANSGPVSEDTVKISAQAVNQLTAAGLDKLAGKITAELADNLEKTPALREAFDHELKNQPAKVP
ncbi:MAG TPA: hypothetical protein PLS03_17070, partial [Terrimicrobiaceae bacterium]|nr:hypothetical protein [Terrimicrobiaceae bacterium]